MSLNCCTSLSQRQISLSELSRSIPAAKQTTNGHSNLHEHGPVCQGLLGTLTALSQGHLQGITPVPHGVSLTAFRLISTPAKL